MHLEEEFPVPFDDPYWGNLSPPPEDATSFFSSVPEEIVAGKKKVYENAGSIVRVDVTGEEREINRIQYQQYRITNENGDV